MARVVGSPQRISAGRRLAALAVVGAFTIAACSSDSDSGSSAGDSSGSSSDKALVIARGMDVNSLDPSRAYCDTCQIYMTAVYETLIGLDDDNTTLVPRLATAWESNAEQTEFTFTLDPTAKFADGSAVTSADVKYSWERLAGLQGSASYLVGSIEAIDTPDDGTVKVTLSASNSAFLAQVNAGYLGIMNKKVAEANGATTDPTTDKAEEWFLANSAGSGPYTLKSYAAGAELRLERNDAYWGAAPAFPEVIIKETPQAVTQRQQLEEGSVDIAMQISNDVAAGMSGSDVVVEQVPSFNFVYLALSPGAAGGEELTPEVREAIRLALDYDGLVDATVGGAGQPQASPIPNGFAGTDGLAAPKQDLAKAQDLLTAAGVTTLTLDATYPSLNVYGVDFSTAMQKVQTDLKAVGIELQLNPVEISVWADKITTDGIPVTMLYFAPDHTDSSQYVQYFGMLEGSQWQGWTRADPVPEQADLLDQALAEQDPAARADLYQALANSMIADQLIIPVVNPNLFLASRSDIKGMHYSACCNLDLARLSRG
ncbi:MAG: ABC transporter substrate-binding protein [Ilumatobacteraceae bacterium]|nr:ABC transporter substrate-binding protein [Acidimicrobiaceae bacterium]MBP6489454.1 ABC transporter substrate-binding protein [Ilumatobacteraceae bacterium]MBK9970264.1 ABC transporter substrate-binding protein [Acidimicrobiaceae bacterium]MBP7888525.1 ABC transporter substrate-binding protein [Ilumatobacteraceae bacterium]MBP8208414.1 ABC transporter substrate-binding protein [Ilumatobacteraceae bacterium]